MSERAPGDNVLLQMFRTSQAVRALMAQVVSTAPVTPDEYAVLSMIGLLRAASPTELSTRLRVPPTSVSRYVAHLVDARLAARSPNPSDGRSYVLELTERGRSVVETVTPRLLHALDELRDRAPIDEIEAALLDLEKAATAVAAIDTTTVR
jgi:DNA-binding MarR family transcriptional regulator